MPADQNNQSNWTAGANEWEPWMELVDWDTLDWIPNLPAVIGEGR
jgi:hypothetical protein